MIISASPVDPDKIHYHGKLLRRLTPDQKVKYLELHRAQKAARKAYTEFGEKHDYQKKTIEAEVGKAEKAAGIDEDE